MPPPLRFALPGALTIAALAALIAPITAGGVWLYVQQRPVHIHERMLGALSNELATGQVASAMDALNATIVDGTAISNTCTLKPARCTYKASMAYRMPETADEPAVFVILLASADVDQSDGAPPVAAKWRWEVVMAGLGEHRKPVNLSTGAYTNLARTPASRGTNASVVLLKAMETGIEKGLAGQG